MLLAAFAIFGSNAFAQTGGNDLPEADARVVRLTSPDSYVLRAGSEEKEILVAGTFVYEGDRLFSEGGTVVLSFSNGSNLLMQRGSDLYIETLRQEPYDEGMGSYGALQADPSRSQTRVFLSEGSVLGHVKQLRSDSVFRVETPIGTAGIRGTRFKVTLTMVDDRLTMALANFDGSVVLERTFTLDTGEVVSDEIQVLEGETVEYIVEIDIETEGYRADPQTSIIRAIRTAQETLEETDELGEADEEADEFHQNNPVSPPLMRATPDRPAPTPPARAPVRAATPPPAPDAPDELDESRSPEDYADEDPEDPPEPIDLPDPDHPDLENPSPMSNQ